MIYRPAELCISVYIKEKRLVLKRQFRYLKDSDFQRMNSNSKLEAEPCYCREAGMRKNFERIIFAVSVCVLVGVLFIQGMLYLRSLGFSEEPTLLSVAVEQPTAEDPQVLLEEPVVKKINLRSTENDPKSVEENLIPVELALAESSPFNEEPDESNSEGPVLKLPHADETRQPLNLEAQKPEFPALLKPTPAFPQTPGPLMPPLNAEPLQDSKKSSDSRDDQITRSIINEHLPHASKEELEIWFEELQGVPHKVASDMLSIRKMLQPKSVLNVPEAKGHPSLPGLTADSAQQPVSSPKAVSPDQSGFIGFSSKADHDELTQRLKPTVDALRLSRDVIVNNIANAGTVGFKRSYVEFESLPYEYLETPASEESKTEPPIAVGMGSHVLQTRISQTKGELIKTGRALDLAIEGKGFLQVKLAEKTAFTRSGRLTLDQQGRLCLDGSQRMYSIVPEIRVPNNAYSIQISDSGVVTVMVPIPEKREGKEQTVGQLSIVCFTDQSELVPRESCLFEATPRSGAPRVLTPGTKGAGLIRAGVLEASNVSISEELEALSQIKQRLDALKAVYLTEPNEPVQADLGLPAERIAQPGAKRLQRENRPVFK